MIGKLNRISNPLAIRGGGWNPSLIPGINAWFDGLDVATMRFEFPEDPLKLSKWYDKIGGVKVYEGALATAPSFSSVDGVVFSGAQFMRRAHTLNSATNITNIYVLKLTGIVPNAQCIRSHLGKEGSTPGQITDNIKSDITELQMQCGKTLKVLPTSYAVMSGAYRVYIFNYIPTTANSTIKAFSAQAPSGDLSGTGDAGSRFYDNGAYLYMGSYYTGLSQFLKGNVICMISVLGTMSADDIAKFVLYSNMTYGSAK